MTQSIAHVLALSVSLVGCQAPDRQTSPLRPDAGLGCASDRDCSQGAICNFGYDPAHCQLPNSSGDGEPCVQALTDRFCQAPFACLVRTCQLPGPGMDCSTSLLCKPGSVCTNARICGEGTICRDSVECAIGQVCNFGACTPAGQGDEAAACSTDEFCAMGLSCVPKPDDILIDTTCRPPSYDGYCNTAADCVSPQVCDIRWSHYGKCAMP